MCTLTKTFLTSLSLHELSVQRDEKITLLHAAVYIQGSIAPLPIRSLQSIARLPKKIQLLQFLDNEAITTPWVSPAVMYKLLVAAYSMYSKAAAINGTTDGRFNFVVL
jgi:hypothetical protein